MVKVCCPQCNRTFFWTDEMPTKGKCPNPDCSWLYNVHEVLSENVARHLDTAAMKIFCPFCHGEIRSRWTVCAACGRVVLNNWAFPKRYVLLAVCIFLVLISYFFNYLMR